MQATGGQIWNASAIYVPVLVIAGEYDTWSYPDDREPFFTTKEPGKGTGMGLAVSQSIMRDCTVGCSGPSSDDSPTPDNSVAAGKEYPVQWKGMCAPIKTA